MRRSLSVERKRSSYRLVVNLVCQSVRKVYCGKTADCIWMPFGVVTGVGRAMGLYGVKILEGERAVWGKCGA